MKNLNVDISRTLWGEKSTKEALTKQISRSDEQTDTTDSIMDHLPSPA